MHEGRGNMQTMYNVGAGLRNRDMTARLAREYRQPGPRWAREIVAIYQLLDSGW